jgi:hypothetical protein
MSWQHSIARAEVQVATATMLIAQARAIRVDALWARVCAQELRGTRRLHGASDDDASRVVSLRLDHTMCGLCIAGKTGLPTARIDDLLLRLGHIIHSRVAIGVCEVCQKETVVYRVR